MKEKRKIYCNNDVGHGPCNCHGHDNCDGQGQGHGHGHGLPRSETVVTSRVTDNIERFTENYHHLFLILFLSSLLF